VLGAIYFLPQARYLRQPCAPHVLLEENPDETFLAVLVSRAAGEHPTQPDPYQAAPRAEPTIAFYTIQRFPLLALGLIARALGLPVTVLLWAGSLVFPVILAFETCCIAWWCGIRRWSTAALAVVLAMLALDPLHWFAQAKYTALALAGSAPDYLLMLPYSRRLQPQFVAIFHLLAILLSLLLLRAGTRASRLACAAGAGICFGISFYSYFYSWSILAGWFALGAIFVRLWHRGRERLWLSAAALGLAISIPYWIWCARHFSELSLSTGSARTHRLGTFDLPEVLFYFGVAGLCLLLLRKDTARRELLWVPLVLVAVPALGAIQNLITGIYIQPYHYLHYFGRPAANLAVVAVLASQSHRFAVLRGRAADLAAWTLIALAIFSARVVQMHRYGTASVPAARICRAMPALEFLERRGVAGAAVFTPDPDLREAIPLYTDAVPYYSRFSWMTGGAATRDAVLWRIASSHALAGQDRHAFLRLVQSRPWDLFQVHKQRTLDPQAEPEMAGMERVLLEQFDSILASNRTPVFEGLRYALLPADRPLESTRLLRYFTCRQVWSDAAYSVFELERRVESPADGKQQRHAGGSRPAVD